MFAKAYDAANPPAQATQQCIGTLPVNNLTAPALMLLDGTNRQGSGTIMEVGLFVSTEDLNGYGPWTSDRRSLPGCM